MRGPWSRVNAITCFCRTWWSTSPFLVRVQSGAMHIWCGGKRWNSAATIMIIRYSLSLYSNLYSPRPACWPRHSMLWLGMPNSVLTDLVVFLFFLYLIWLNMTATLSLCFSLLFTLCRMHTSLHSSLCSAWPCPTPSLPFCHRHAVALCLISLPFHGRAWCTLLPHATRIRNILEQSSVDPIQIGTNICSSI